VDELNGSNSKVYYGLRRLGTAGKMENDIVDLCDLDYEVRSLSTREIRKSLEYLDSIGLIMYKCTDEWDKVIVKIL
jgi:hypothetical protein